MKVSRCLLLLLIGLLLTNTVHGFCFSMGGKSDRPYHYYNYPVPAVGFIPQQYYAYPYSAMLGNTRYGNVSPVISPYPWGTGQQQEVWGRR